MKKKVNKTLSAVAETLVTITLDGREVRARYREPVLDVTRRYDIYIPTLCHHDALEPAAACRLCVVEVVRNGRSKIVTACNFPVEEGLEIRTSTERVRRSRRMTIESLLARCGEVPEIQRLAREHGVERSRFTAQDDTCILCTLCTRVCDSYVTSAIATIERGAKKYIGTFGGDPPEECVACGACAEICPTDHIKVQREGSSYRIWDREFELSLCEVVADSCRACGACEAACPWSIPRVVLRKGAAAAAWIDPEICKACGVCLAACPADSIRQPRDLRRLPRPEGKAGGRLLVIACARSKLSSPLTPELPEGARVLELSCSGAASHAMLLAALAQGFDGVLVLGRHEASCRLDGAESQVKRVVQQVDELAGLVGLGAGRVAFRDPAAGSRGPAEEVHRFAKELSRSPLESALAEDAWDDSLDGALETLRWLSGRTELMPSGEAWLAAHGLPPARPGQPALLAAAVPYLDIALTEWLGADSLAGRLREALELLAAFGIEAGVAVGGFRAGEPRLIAHFPGSAFFSLCGGCGDRVEAAGGVVTPMAQLLAERGAELGLPARTLAVAAGPQEAQRMGLAGFDGDVVEVTTPAVQGMRLAITSEERRLIEARFLEAERAGAAVLLTSGPAQLVQYALACREGSWRQAHVRPLLATTIAAAGLAAKGQEQT